MAALEVAMETSIGRWLGLEVGVATAITVVCDIVDGHLLFGIHDCSRRLGATSRERCGEVERRNVAHDRRGTGGVGGGGGCYVREETGRER